MRIPALMAAICLTTLSACAQAGPGPYGENGPPPGYGQNGPPPGYGQGGPPPGYAGQGGPQYAQNAQQGAPGGWAGGMQGAGGQAGPQDQGPPPPPPVDDGPAPGAGGRGHGGAFMAKFQAANVTHDGRLTQQQAAAGGMRKVAQNFAQIDRDQKGYVTIQDLRAWRHEQHAQKMGTQPGAQYQGTPAYPPPAPAGGYGQQPPPPAGQQY